MKKIILITYLLLSCPLYAQNVLLITLPKTGTNLALKLLESISHETTFFHLYSLTRNIYWCHEWDLLVNDPNTLGFAPNDEKIAKLKSNNVKVILLLRDPRQHITALLRSLKKVVNPNNIEWVIKNFPHVLALQTGSKSFLKYHTITQCYKDYLAWIDQYPWVYVTTYEKLVGPQGGGNIESQREEILKISNFLGETINEDECQKIVSTLYGGTHTFQEGEIDTWKKHFSPSNRELFKSVTGDLLIQLGYEKDNAW